MSLKDDNNLPGKLTTWGLTEWSKKPVNNYGAVPAVLMEQGAVFYCKTSVPQCLMERICGHAGGHVGSLDLAGKGSLPVSRRKRSEPSHFTENDRLTHFSLLSLYIAHRVYRPLFNSIACLCASARPIPPTSTRSFHFALVLRDHVAFSTLFNSTHLKFLRAVSDALALGCLLDLSPLSLPTRSLLFLADSGATLTWFTLLFALNLYALRCCSGFRGHISVVFISFGLRLCLFIRASRLSYIKLVLWLHSAAHFGHPYVFTFRSANRPGSRTTRFGTRF